MKRLKYIIGLLLVATATASAAPITVKATMDSTTLLIGEQRTIHLEVEQPKIVTLLFPDFKENNILANGVEVLRTSRKDTTVIKGGNLRIKEDLIVTPDELSRVWLIRKYLNDMNPVDAMEFLHANLKEYKTNTEYLLTINPNGGGPR